MYPHYHPFGRTTLLLCFAAILLCLPGYAQISGAVYRDFDGSGTRTLVDPNEIGADGVKVRAYVGNSNTPLLTVTNDEGEFSFSAAQIPPGSDVKIEFYDLGKWNYSGPFGLESHTTLQFLKSPNDMVQLGIYYPAEYCGTSSPAIVTSCFVNGDALGGGSAGESVALIKFPYNASGVTSPTNSPPKEIGLVKEVGAVWGIMYHKKSQKFVTAAILKRHAGFGPLGTGGMYLTDANTGKSTTFVDLKILGIDTGDDPHIGLSANSTAPSLDTATLRQVGKMSLGALTTSEDGERVFITNLKDRKIYRLYVGDNLSMPTKDSIHSYTIPNNCPEPGDFRPWALKSYRGEVYVGTVCSGETNKDSAALSATIYKFDPQETNPTFTSVLSFPLTFKRGSPDMSVGCVRNYWHAWDDKFPLACNGQFVLNPQPILSDIEFDVDGKMMIGIMDRFGHQSGRDNYGESLNGGLFTGFSGGDLMRASLESNGTYTIESNGDVGGLIGCGAGNGEGNGGGEFYCGDEWIFQGKVAHGETNIGAMAFLPGSGEVISTSMDPVDSPTNELYLSAGWKAFDNGGATPGGANRTFLIYDSKYAGTFGKAAGLGDIVAACNAAPIEIGNRVWLDKNRNNIQDAGEPGIPGIIITLHDAANGFAELAKDTTDSQGGYYFSNANVPSGVKFKHKYEVRISMNQPTISTDSLVPVKHSVGDKMSDSDGIMVTPTPAPNLAGAPAAAKNGRVSAALAEEPYVRISLNSGDMGQNNHDYDYGFGPASAIELVTDSIRICSGEVTILIAQVENVLPGDSVAFILYDKVPTTIEEKLNSGTKLGTVAPDGTGLATLPNVIFPANTTADSASYIVCALFLAKDTTVLGVDDGSVVIDPIPVVLATVDGTLTCTQRIVNLRARSSLDSTSFSWTGPGGFTSSDSIAPVSVAGTYVLVGSTLQGCLSAPDTIVVEENFPSALPMPEIAFCEPISTTQLPALKKGQEWYVNSVNPATISIDTVSNIASGLTANGIFYIKLREGFCISEDSLKITRNPALTLKDSTTDICTTVTVDLANYIPGYAALVDPVWHRGSASGATIPTVSGVQITANVTYVLIARNAGGCADTALVNFVIQSMPAAFLNVTPPTCDSGSPLTNGKMTLAGILPAMRYDLVQSNNYNGNATFASATRVPQDGDMGSDWASPAIDTPYTMRVFNETGCFLDLFVSLSPVDCACPIVCVPVTMRIIKK